MNVQNISYNFNPFALTTTQKILADKTSCLPARICKGTVAIAYDIYVKNPYELIIGNCKKLITATQPQSVKTKISVCATAILATPYTMMLYGSSIHLLGISLQSLASATSLTALPLISEATKKIGKDLFVAGAVPFYGVFYALPKHIIKILPDVLRATVAKINIAANWTIQHVLTPLWNHVILPAAQMAYQGLKFVATKISAALEAINKVIVQLAKWTFQQVLTPLWKNVIVPSAQMAYQGLKFVATKISIALEAINKVIVELAKWTFQHVLSPLWNNALLPTLKLVEKAAHFVVTQMNAALQIIGSKVASAAQWTFHHALKPLWNNAGILWNEALLPALKLLEKNIVCIAKKFGHATSDVARAVSQAAQWIFSQVIIPTWGRILPVLKKIGNVLAITIKAAVEAIQLLAKETAGVASFIFQKFIVPAFKVLRHHIVAAGNFIGNHVITPLKSILVALAVRIGSVFKTVVENAIIPTLNVVTSSFTALGNAATHLSAEISKTLAEVWARSRWFLAEQKMKIVV